MNFPGCDSTNKPPGFFAAHQAFAPSLIQQLGCPTPRQVRLDFFELIMQRDSDASTNHFTIAWVCIELDGTLKHAYMLHAQD